MICEMLVAITVPDPTAGTGEDEEPRVKRRDRLDESVIFRLETCRSFGPATSAARRSRSSLPPPPPRIMKPGTRAKACQPRVYGDFLHRLEERSDGREVRGG